MAIVEPGSRVSPSSESLENRPKRLTLDPSPSMAELLDTLSKKMECPVEDVITQAVALLKIAVDAQGRGQRLCLVDDDLKITGEIVDFGIEGEEAGIDPFPDSESDRLDS